MIRLSDLHLQAIRQHGADTFPHECVGVLLGSVEGGMKTVEEVRPLPNTFEPSEEFERSVFTDASSDFNQNSNQSDPQAVPQAVQTVGQERRYLLAPDTMFALMQEERRTKRKVLGFYHSHPDHPARPSVYDREWASPWYTYIIVSVLQGKPDALTAWQLNDNRDKFHEEEIRQDLLS